mgnify:CR=1 FL=1
MTNKKFVDLVYKSLIHDNFNLYEAALAVKDHYNIDDQQFIEIINSERTLKDDLINCCQEMKLLKKNKTSNIANLF